MTKISAVRSTPSLAVLAKKWGPTPNPSWSIPHPSLSSFDPHPLGKVNKSQLVSGVTPDVNSTIVSLKTFLIFFLEVGFRRPRIGEPPSGISRPRVWRIWPPAPRIGKKFLGAFRTQVGGFSGKMGFDSNVELEVPAPEFVEFGPQPLVR